MKFFFLLTLLFMVIPGFIKCTSPTTIAGGASGTEVSGCVVDTAGIPLPGAIVRLRPANYLFDSLQHFEYDTRHSLLDTTTNSNGTFSFNNILADSYCVDISLKDSIAVSMRFSSKQPVSVVQLPIDTARTMSILDGRVSVYGADSSHSFVQIYGSEYKMQPDSNGFFYMRVPRGVHTMHIGAYDKPMSQKPKQMDALEITFDADDEFKSLGSLSLQIPPRVLTDFSYDSIVLRKALDSMMLGSVSVDSVCIVRDNRIVGVSLRGIKFFKLSPEITNLTELTELDLGLTDAFDIYFVGGIVKLTILRLDSNKIVYLPPSIVNLTGLKELDLSANELKCVPYVHG